MVGTSPHAKPLTVAILGAGGIAETHATVLKGIPEVQLLAVCDSSPGKAESFRRKFALAESFASLQDMLVKLKLDVVHVATPPFVHAKNAIECLEAGAHVFVEKPLAVSSEEADNVGMAAARSGRIVGVNHNLTFHPSVMRMLDAVRQRRLGGLEHAIVCYNMPMPIATGPYSHWLFQRTENIVFELAPHPFSVIEKLFGPLRSVSTLVSGERVLPSGVRFFPTWQVCMECERGTAQLYLSVGGDLLDLWIRVEAEDGAAQVDLRRNTFRLVEKSHLLRPNDDLRDSISGAMSLLRDGVRNYKDYILSALGRPAPFPASFTAMNLSIKHFYSALLAGEPPSATLAHGTAVVEACEAAVTPVVQCVASRNNG